MTFSSQDQGNARRHATPNGWLSLVSCQPRGAEQVMLHSGHLHPDYWIFLSGRSRALPVLGEPGCNQAQGLAISGLYHCLSHPPTCNLTFHLWGWRQKSRTVTRDRGTKTHPWPPLPEHPPPHPQLTETQFFFLFITYRERSQNF